MITTVIIGSGNVAEALAVALSDSANGPLQIFARNRERGEKIAAMVGCEYEWRAEKLAKADLYIISVSDKTIEKIVSQLDFDDSVVAHTGGSVPMDALAEIHNRAVFYPMQTFTAGRKVDFSDVPIMIEGYTPKALETMRKVAGLLSKESCEVDSEQRAMIHLAAVFVCNFTNHMYAIGEELALGAGMSFSQLKPLIRETAAKAIDATSPRLIQTGPAIRNDFATKSLHCEMLSERPDLKSIYINLSKSIWETSKKI